MTRLFTAALLSENQKGQFPENGRLVNVPKAVNPVLRSPRASVCSGGMLAPVLDYAAGQGLAVKDEIFWALAFY